MPLFNKNKFIKTVADDSKCWLFLFNSIDKNCVNGVNQRKDLYFDIDMYTLRCCVLSVLLCRI